MSGSQDYHLVEESYITLSRLFNILLVVYDFGPNAVLEFMRLSIISPLYSQRSIRHQQRFTSQSCLKEVGIRQTIPFSLSLVLLGYSLLIFLSHKSLSTVFCKLILPLVILSMQLPTLYSWHCSDNWAVSWNKRGISRMGQEVSVSACFITMRNMPVTYLSDHIYTTVYFEIKMGSNMFYTNLVSLACDNCFMPLPAICCCHCCWHCSVSLEQQAGCS